MSPLKPVTIVTPDGVSRELRDTPGVRKRLFDKYGESNPLALIKEKGDWIIFEIAYLMMGDKSGKHPVDLALEDFMDCPSADALEVAAAITSAASNGQVSKNAVEELLREAQTEATRSLGGSESGVSQPLSGASDSLTSNSGGATPGQN